MLVSEFTRDGIGDYFEFRLVDTIKYKGKVTPGQVIELLGLKGEVDRKMLEIRDNFEEALKFYREGNFTRARDIFGKLAEEGDKPSEVFKTRCEDFIASPPSDWTGVWVMDKK